MPSCPCTYSAPTQSAIERLGAAGVDGNLAASAGHLDRVQRVLDLLVEGDVAAADGDRVEARVRGGAGRSGATKTSSPAVSVSMIRRGHAAATASRSSSCARVGRPAITPSCSTMCAPAAQPRRTASASGEPFGQRDGERRAEGVAGAGGVHGRRGERGHLCPAPSRAPWSPSVTTSVPSAILTAGGLASRSASRSRRPVRSAAPAPAPGSGSCARLRRDRPRAHSRAVSSRDLQLHEQDVGGLDLRREGVDVARVSTPRARRGRSRSGCRRSARPGSPRSSSAAARAGLHSASTASSAHSSKAPSCRRRPHRSRSGSRPRRRGGPQPTAWFDPLPPWSCGTVEPTSVSPRSGARSSRR